MTDVIDLLDRLGREACFHGETAGEVARELEGADIDPAIKSAILSGDAKSLRSALGQGVMVSLVMPAEEEEGEEEPEDVPDPKEPAAS